MWLKIGPTGLPNVFCVQRTHDIPTNIRLRLSHKKRSKQQSVKEKRIVQVEAKSNCRGYDAPLPRPPARPPTPREYLYAKFMEWTVWED